MYRARLLCKNPAYGRHYLSWRVRILALCQKLNQKFGCGDNPRIQSGKPPCLKAQGGDYPEQNAGMIHASNLEHLLVVKALRLTIQNRTRGQSTGPVQNTFSF